ncbi:unnamed protein product [Dracunculus medinensis]|uniref:SEC7 domain-containing protein n=1 Tax=Dracunculus medinensis TaxID=318479 RepID=A0A0N4U6W3_DRAME|nr:unnamed protein product [Dracunculus medinensis]
MLKGRRTQVVSTHPLDSYEISDDLNRRKIQVLERRYGGRIRAHTAATRIQRAFRQYRLLQQWRNLILPLRNNRSQFNFQCDRLRKPIGLRDYRSCGLLRNAIEPYRNLERNCISTSSVNPNRAYRTLTRHNDHHLFHPSISLSAQLRSDQFEKTNSPICGLIRNPVLYPQKVQEKRAIAELISPRLSHRRIKTDDGETSVWVPRSSFPTQQSNHTNSLPRLNIHIDSAKTHQSSDQLRRRQYRIALNFFNKKPSRGIQFLVDWGFVQESAIAVAKLLIGRRGLSKQMIGEYLGNLHDEFNSYVLKYFIDEIDLHGMEIDIALRHTLTFFRLPGEAQKIERIMEVFSRRYAFCNPDQVAYFHSPDTIFILAFAIIMLNTDLHSHCIKPARKMKLDEFINNLRGIDAGHDIDIILLTRIYQRIKKHEFLPCVDHVTQVIKVDQSIIGKDKPKLVEPQRRLVCYCRLNQVIDCTKRQAANAHQRDVFLFNDLILITKVVSKKKVCVQYSLRWWSSLISLRIRSFESTNCPLGLSLRSADGQEFIFNAKNEDDRLRFIADVRESILECSEMEAIRIEYELDKHSLSSRNGSQRDSGLPDVEVIAANGNSKNFSSVISTARRLSFNSFDSGVMEESNADTTLLYS